VVTKPDNERKNADVYNKKRNTEFQMPETVTDVSFDSNSSSKREQDHELSPLRYEIVNMQLVRHHPTNHGERD